MIILTIFITIILSIDWLISSTADILQSFIITPLGIALFAICTIASIVTQVVFMYYIKGSWSSLLEKSVFAIQSIINFLLVYILLEIIFMQQYESQILIFITSLSYLISIFLCGNLAVKFFQWLKINKHYIIFFYFIAVTFFCFNFIINLILADILLFQKPTIITPDLPVIFDIGFEEGTIMSYISLIQSISMNIYFVALWLGTIGILRYNIRKIGKVKFWIIITLPIIYFIGYELSLYQYIYPENPVTSSISSDFLYPILLYAFSFIICGVLFGVSFFILRSHVKNDILGKYLVTTGIGLIIFFISGNATLLQAAYPPYGAPSIAFLGLATYFIFIGLYKSALSISHDYALLKTIENSIIKDSNLLNLIGKSQFELEAYKKVKSITDKFKDDNVTHELATEMNDEEIKKHINTIAQVRKQMEKEEDP